jgi:hypothetical protein
MKSLGSQLPSILVQRSKLLDELNQQFLMLLPLEFHGHVQIASLHRSFLTLEADSPVWAAKTRYLTDEIKKQFSTKTGERIKSIKLIIRPQHVPTKKSRRKIPYISKYSAHQLETLAHSIKHPGLENSLSRLAKRAIKKG